jgi:hypothetical protein
MRDIRGKNYARRFTDPTGLQTIKEPGECTEDEVTKQEQKIIEEAGDSDHQISQKELEKYLGGNSSCHFWSLGHMAERASGEYLNIYAWNRIKTLALEKGAMDDEYTVLPGGRNTVLKDAFSVAGLKEKPFAFNAQPWSEAARSAKAAILRGNQYKSQNLAMLEHGVMPPIRSSHFESGYFDGVLEADPYGHRLSKYNPYEVYYYVTW